MQSPPRIMTDEQIDFEIETIDIRLNAIAKQRAELIERKRVLRNQKAARIRAAHGTLPQ